MKELRTAWNAAINEGIVSLELYPLRRYKLKKGAPVPKVKLSIDQINEMSDLDISSAELFSVSLDFVKIGPNVVITVLTQFKLHSPLKTTTT